MLPKATVSSAIVPDVIASRPPVYTDESTAEAILVTTEKTAIDNENCTLDIDPDDDGHFVGNDEEHPAPTAEEDKELRKVAGTIPPIAYILCVVEFAERASYYGATQVFNNFLQKPLPHGM
jgi:hypothetical protein